MLFFASGQIQFVLGISKCFWYGLVGFLVYFFFAALGLLCCGLGVFTGIGLLNGQIQIEFIRSEFFIGRHAKYAARTCRTPSIYIYPPLFSNRKRYENNSF